VLFNREYPVVKPDLVVVHYFIRDVEPIGKARNNLLFKHSYLAAFLYDRLRVLQFTTDRKFDLFEHYQKLYQEDSPSWQLVVENLRQMKAVADRDHVPFLVMIIPDIHNLSDTSPYRDLYQKIDGRFERLGLATLNTFDAFNAEFGKNEAALWIQADDPHPNAKGHALMARSLYDYLVTTKPLIPRRQ
jgi:hypothetical protein